MRNDHDLNSFCLKEIHGVGDLRGKCFPKSSRKDTASTLLTHKLPPSLPPSPFLSTACRAKPQQPMPLFGAHPPNAF